MKKILFILFLIPLLTTAQTSNTWKLFSAKKIVLQGNADQVKEYEISAKNLNKLKLTYFADSATKTWNKSIVIMDAKRREVFRKDLKYNENSFFFGKEKNIGKIFSKPLTVYVLSIPADKNIASKIKVRPVPLLKLIPKN